jgi:predicted RNase H-like HicB family nuclease
MDELTFVVEQEEDGGFVAHAIGQSIFTRGDTRAELDNNVRDAIRCHFDRAEDRPRRVRLHFIRDEVMAL